MLPAAALIVAAAFLAYANTFQSPFLFDDLPRIVKNALVHDAWPPWRAMSHTSRPLVQLSFAINWAVSGLAPWSYHLVNVALHASNGVLLFALIRRTLRNSPACARYRDAAHGLALSAALLWTVHPLATEAVTYIVQRSESLATLFYLLALGALARGAASRAPAPWYAGVVAACAAGMACKPMMASAPIVALLYDRVFLAGSFRGALRERGWVHVATFATLALLPLLLAGAPMDWRYSSAQGAGITPLEYARTQPGVVLHYLRLAVWPVGLVLDYAWPVTSQLAETLAPAAVLAALALVTLVLLARCNALGFLGAFFFLVLAPTSSVVPILDLAFEHRMYLPLAAVVTAAVIGGAELLRRIARTRALDPRVARRGAMGAVMAVALALAGLTFTRNASYASAVAIWTDTARLRPENLRARVNLAYALAERVGPARGLAEAEAVLARNPGYAWAHLAAGYFLIKLGRIPESIPRLKIAVRDLPESAEAHYFLGSAMSELGDYDHAIPELERSVTLEPWRPEAENNLGAAYLRRGDFDAAIPHLTKAVALQPEYANARFNLAVAYGSKGDLASARRELEGTLAVAPGYAAARQALDSLGVEGPR